MRTLVIGSKTCRKIEAVAINISMYAVPVEEIKNLSGKSPSVHFIPDSVFRFAVRSWDSLGTEFCSANPIRIIKLFRDVAECHLAGAFGGYYMGLKEAKMLYDHFKAHLTVGGVPWDGKRASHIATENVIIEIYE
jgi:hypothetical protein